MAAQHLRPCDGLDVRLHPRFGLSAYATRAFKAGEVVVCEDPILLSLDNEHPFAAIARKALRQHAGEADLQAGLLPTMYLPNFLGWCAAPEKVRARLLQVVQCTVPDEASASEQVRSCRQAAEWIHEHVYRPHLRGKVSGVAGPADVERVLLAWKLNTHRVDGRMCLFEINSKFAHTCGTPSCRYYSSGGQGRHVAMRDIREGELLTTTYLQQPMVLMSTPARQNVLWNVFAFECGCDRCTSPSADALLRTLPCPLCCTPDLARNGFGELPERVARGEAATPGMLRYEPNASSHPGRPWACGGCGRRLRDDVTVLLGGDNGLAKFVLGLAGVGEAPPGARAAAAAGGGGGEATSSLPLAEGAADAGTAAAAAAAAAGGARGTAAQGQQPTAAAAAVGPAAGASPSSSPSSSASPSPSSRGILPDDASPSSSPGFLLEAALVNLVEGLSGLLQGGRLEALEDRALMVQQMVGPGHWASTAALLVHADFMAAQLQAVCLELHKVRKASAGQVPPTPAAAPQVTAPISRCIGSMERDWERAWAWIERGTAGVGEPGSFVFSRLQEHSRAILDARDALSQLLATGAQPLSDRMQKLAWKLLDRSEPTLEVMRQWHTPEPHPAVTQGSELRVRCEAPPAVVACSSGDGGGGDKVGKKKKGAGAGGKKGRKKK